MGKDGEPVRIFRNRITENSELCRASRVSEAKLVHQISSPFYFRRKLKNLRFPGEEGLPGEPDELLPFKYFAELYFTTTSRRRARRRRPRRTDRVR